jgi:hypothetical protein
MGSKIKAQNLFLQEDKQIELQQSCQKQQKKLQKSLIKQAKQKQIVIQLEGTIQGLRKESSDLRSSAQQLEQQFAALQNS